MKSCIEWRKGFKYLPQIDEFNIDYKRKETQLLKFLQKYAKSQRVNIRVPLDFNKNDIELLEALYHDRKYNITIILPEREAYFAKMLHQHNTPFYFSTPCWDWDEFIDDINFGVSDIFVSGTLGFDLVNVSKIAKRNNIQIRCYANITQATRNSTTNGFKNFYIRPEDVDFYSQYINVIEFFNSEDQQNTLYQIYFKDKEWNGNLREIIKGLSFDINNYYILGSEFARRRSECSKRCLKGDRCSLCDRLASLAKTLEDNKEY